MTGVVSQERAGSLVGPEKKAIPKQPSVGLYLQGIEISNTPNAIKLESSGKQVDGRSRRRELTWRVAEKFRVTSSSEVGAYLPFSSPPLSASGFLCLNKSP